MELEHQHLLVRALVEKPINNVEQATLWVTALVNNIGLRFLHEPVGAYCDDKGNQGVTVVAILNASHIALHIWDEQNPALLQLDVYSCRRLDVRSILDSIKLLKPQLVEHRIFDRSLALTELIPDGR